MKKRVLILGVTGMMGHTLFRELSEESYLEVYGTAQSPDHLESWFGPELVKKIREDVDANNFDTMIRAFASIRPDIVINCIGLIKQAPLSEDPLSAITLNSLLPHRLSMTCRSAGARLIHISTDCIFDGLKGNYTESDPPSPIDLYGRSKLLGEVTYPHCLTLRTSIIGHELKGKRGLVEWFLSQQKTVQGYRQAIYTGFPSVELSRIIKEYVIPNESLCGIFHVSSSPISKYDLLRLVATRYQKEIEIMPYDGVRLDRSLNSARFREMTGYAPPAWPELVDLMHSSRF